MEVTSIAEWKERKLEALIEDFASQFNDCYSQSEKLAAYIKDLSSLNPGNPYLDFARGIFNATACSYDKSIEHFSMFLEKYPSHLNAIAWRLESLIYFYARSSPRKPVSDLFALKLCDDALKLYPNSQRVLHPVQLVYSECLVDVEKALDVAEKLNSMETDDPVWWEETVIDLREKLGVKNSGGSQLDNKEC